MDITTTKQNENSFSINIDFDSLLEEFTPEICQALARRRQVLNEIAECARRFGEDLSNTVITKIRASRDADSAISILMNDLKISAPAAKFLLECPLSNPGWEYEDRMQELEGALDLLKTKLT